MRNQVVAVALAVLLFIAAAGIATAIREADTSADGRFEIAARHLARLDAADVEFARKVESLDQHLAESVRVSHERRAVLADELRREMGAAVAKVSAAVAEESATRESDVGEIVAIGIAVEAEIKRLADVDRRLLGRIDVLEKRLRAVETKPVPAPVVIEKTVQVPVYMPAPTPVYLYPVMPRRCH
jgi:hypothetical protein